MPHCIVLAGGRSTRMGEDKAQVTVAGQRLVDITLAGLASVTTGRIVIVSPHPLALPEDVALTSEDPPFGGPVAGIEAGMAALGPLPAHEHVAVLTVDAPFAAELVPQLCATLGTTAGGHQAQPQVAHVDGEPLCAAWLASGLKKALEAIKEQRGTVRDRSAWSLIRACDAGAIATIDRTGQERDYDSKEELVHLIELLKDRGQQRN